LKLTHFYEILVYYSVFQKKITFDEILKFVKDEQFKYLILESINDNYYGFNLKIKLERKTAKDIVWGNWTVLVNSLSAKSVLAGEKLVATYSIST
jgi:hypothetical protein